jgi:hypothetical protein
MGPCSLSQTSSAPKAAAEPHLKDCPRHQRLHSSHVSNLEIDPRVQKRQLAAVRPARRRRLVHGAGHGAEACRQRPPYGIPRPVAAARQDVIYAVEPHPGAAHAHDGPVCQDARAFVCVYVRQEA